MTSSKTRRDNSAALVAEAPIATLLDDIRADVARIERWRPNDAVAIALRAACDRLETALREARSVDVWLTVDQVARRTNRPRSTISRICRELGTLVGAHLMKGRWSIRWPDFENYLNQGALSSKEAA